MRSYSEYEQLLYSGGDLLFSSVLSVTKSRKKALEIISQASEKYLNSKKRLKTQNERYRFLARLCEKILKRRLPNKPTPDRLTDEEREKLLSSAKIYISSNSETNKSKLIKTIITITIILILIAIVIYEVHYFYSDEFQKGYAEWYKKEEEFQENHGWGHCVLIKNDFK